MLTAKLLNKRSFAVCIYTGVDIMIKRDLLLKKIFDYKDKDIIKIITGIRRCGKSYLLFEIYYKYLIENLETKARAVSAFKGLNDGYKKIIITMDNNPLIRLEDGYKTIHIFDFLLNEDILKEI